MVLQEIQIRSAIPSDSEAVTALLMPQFDEHNIDLHADAVRTAVEGLLADDSRGFILIAFQAAAAIGVACVSFTWTLEHGGKSAWLDELFVVPEERNRGIGKDILEAVLHKARAAGCAAVDLEVDSSHSPAERLYGRAGFTSLQRARWVRDFPS